MANTDPKKLSILWVYKILLDYSDSEHLLTQGEIAEIMEEEYGMEIERKAVGRNIDALIDAGVDIVKERKGAYMDSRQFDESELRLLIDGVLSSKHITAKHSKDLIDKLCSLYNKHFAPNVKYIYSVNDWSKTDNSELFLNIETISDAIAKKLQVSYTYNKYGIDKKLHKSSFHYVTPYQLVLHNQRYYLMGYSEYWGNMVYHRLDHIKKIKIEEDRKGYPLKKIFGFEKGIDYKKLSSSMPYMYSDVPAKIVFIADIGIIDQIIDWFGKDIEIKEVQGKNDKIEVTVKVSPSAMEHWAMQYINFVEVIKPATLRESIKQSLEEGAKKYK